MSAEQSEAVHLKEKSVGRIKCRCLPGVKGCLQIEECSCLPGRMECLQNRVKLSL